MYFLRMEVTKNVGKFLVFAAILALTFFVPYQPVSVAAAGAGMIPFGGRILVVNYCTCSLNLGIKIGPPRGGIFIYQLGVSQLFTWYKIFTPGAWALGTASGGAACMQVRGTYCSPDELTPGGPVIIMVGTSL
ncbi:MAG: hypothetical protein WAP52_00470 [Candidatus Sungiibacteriota bacterium]